MYNDYFNGFEVKPEFDKGFISLWPFWLGEKEYHKLDEVSENEWSRFNLLISKLIEVYEIKIANRKTETLYEASEYEYISYKQYLEKEVTEFSYFVIPELGCVLNEDWDYTYILWHLNNGAIESIKPYIVESGLYHFHG